MDKKGYKEYLISKAGFAESTAKERVDFCRMVENKLSIDLDKIDYDSRIKVIFDVENLYSKYFNVRKIVSSIRYYFDFKDHLCKKVFNYYERCSDHFYKLEDETLPDVLNWVLGELENHYERIMGYSREYLSFSESLGQKIKRIPVILSPERKTETIRISKEMISEKIVEYVKNSKDQVTKKAILDILNKSSYKNIITGEFRSNFCEETPYIILYYNEIGGDTPQEIIANCAMVLAHEYMHYLEYLYCLENGVKDYSNRYLSESMADFFSLLYSIKCATYEFNEAASNRYNLWKKNYYYSWPYSEALYFYRVNKVEMPYSSQYGNYEKHGSIEKLKDIFKSCLDSKIAYDLLKF